VSTLPATIGNWSGIQVFGVGGNNLDGSLPKGIEMWSKLSYFRVEGNQLTGTLPSGFGQCTALTQVGAIDQS
jgi:hypothetical protein